MSLFETGPIMMTEGIRELICLDQTAADTVRNCLEKHMSGNWGDLCDEDKQMNDDALETER